MTREEKVMARSIKGAILVGSAEGRGVTSESDDVRQLTKAAAARAIAVAAVSENKDGR